jgi:hypothetical protein
MLSAVVLRHAILFGILLSLALRRPALKPVPACTDMLCVPCLHDRHIRYLYRIRLRLRPDEEWDDVRVDVATSVRLSPQLHLSPPASHYTQGRGVGRGREESSRADLS